MVDTEIRDAYASDFPCVDGFDECLPGSNPVFLATIRGMQQVQINVVKSRVLQTLNDRFLRPVVADGFRWDF